MECINCHKQMKMIGCRSKSKDGQLYSIYYMCEKCNIQCVQNYNGECTWYDKKGNIIISAN